MLADVNGDGYADIVGFGNTNVVIRLGNGDGTFQTAISSKYWFYKNSGGWTNNNDFPRMLADVNGDGYADIVGFGATVLVSLAQVDGNGNFLGFATPQSQTDIGFAKANDGWNTKMTFLEC
jgi:hypothetical protein